MKASIQEHINELKNNITEEFKKTVGLKTEDVVGKVKKFADGVAHVDGLKLAKIGQKLKFVDSTQRAKEENPSELDIFGVVEDIDEFAVKCLVFGEEKYIKQEDRVEVEDDLLRVPVSKNLLGKAVDPFCRRLYYNYDASVQTEKHDCYEWVKKDAEGKVKILQKKKDVLDLPIERSVAGIIDRGKIDTPLQTGEKAIDAMLPIGRGQRMLVIGDRSIGKTTLGINMIINQNLLNDKINKDTPEFEDHKPETVYCIYVGIGKKVSEINQIVQELKSRGAMKYTVVVASMANDPAPLLYISPFTGCTIGEYFRDLGRNALIIYDDLTKHANAYRQISLILKRPPGREAYPGDVFYLHSRLLERAAKINPNAPYISPEYKKLLDEFHRDYKDADNKSRKFSESKEYQPKRGGSLTAIPFVETKQGDYSSYIATNVISITDGQIFMSEKLKNDGIRPSIDVGLSVSRIGSNAQTKCMKEVSSRLKEVLAIYREKEKYQKFGMELNDSDKRIMERGKRLVEYFKQKQYSPVDDVARQTVNLFALQHGYYDIIPVEGDNIELFEKMVWQAAQEIKFVDIIDKVNKDKEMKFATLGYDIFQKLNGALEGAQLKFFEGRYPVLKDIVNTFMNSYMMLKQFDERDLDSRQGFYYKILMHTKQEYKSQFIKDITDKKLDLKDNKAIEAFFEKLRTVVLNKAKNFTLK